MNASSLALKMLREFPSEVQEYFYKLDKRCQKRRITLRLSSGLAVNNECGRCSGYFDSFNRELAVALGKGWEHAFQVAIHEAAHASQEADSRSVWHTKISDNHTKFFQWLAGKNFKEPRILAQSAMVLERDAERRALAEIRKKYSHLIDPEKYTLRANCYLAGHAWLVKNRRWFRRSPYDRRLMAHCPSKLFRSFDDIPDNLIAAMDRYL
jgi:hypothetical protein